MENKSFFNIGRLFRNKKSSSNKYSLWFVPEGEDFKKSEIWIRHFSNRYSTPFFLPHVVLLENLEGKLDSILSDTSCLSSQFYSPEIVLTRTNNSSNYFRAFNIGVQMNSNLKQISDEAQKMFERNEEYSPCFSLVYGNFSIEDRKKMFGMSSSLDFSFFSPKIYVYSTGGVVKNWFKVEEFPMKKRFFEK
jgi:hypothetical protein